MQTKLRDGSVMVCGCCAKDAELKYVGDKGTPKCTVGLAVGKRAADGAEEQQTVWCNVAAWRRIAEVLSQAQKGDAVFAIGHLETREYNGKTYTDLVAEYVSICAPHAASEPAYPEPVFQEADGDDDKLPF